MKKTFTYLLSTVALTGLLMTSIATEAQTTFASVETMHKKEVAKKDSAAALNTPTVKTAAVADAVDTAWHPQRRLWGYAFGDAYYAQHAPILTSTQGKENNYYQTPSGRNAFQFRRLYLGYDYDINKKFKAEVLLASEPTENTTLYTTSTSTSAAPVTTGVVNGDNLADGRMSFYIKNFNLRVREVWSGTDFVIGEMSTPGFALNEGGTNAPTSLSEATWGYRSIERTITDFHKNNSYDVGVALQGTFDPKTKNFGYVAMIGDNTTSSLTTVYNPSTTTGITATNPNPNTGFFKMFYGDLWGKFFDKHLYLDFYADYAKTASNTAVATTAIPSGSLGPQEHNMYKVFAAYTLPIFTIGVEAYTQKIDNAVLNTTTKTASTSNSKWQYQFGYEVQSLKTNGVTSLVTIITTLIKNSTVLIVTQLPQTNYGSYDATTKENFFTAGLDYTPAKNIHFMPNVWLTQYLDKYATTHTGYVPDNHTLVYRMTFFYTIR